ncbi:MAG: hypothetical protein KF857_01740 [Fimbriimonadaceae bacterium]|nr:hypothetical protein [Fimbriimonadaceae bacterium]
MRTTTLALVALAATTAAWAQDLDKAVTFKTTGMSVADVVAKLRAETKADLRVTGVVGKEVVLIDADGVKASDLMAKLAAAVGGEWVKSDSMYQLLVRDTALRKAVSQRTATDALTVKKALAKMVGQIKPDEPFTPPPPGEGPRIVSDEGVSQVFLSAGGSTAGQKQLARILSGISPLTLASIAPGGRVVFATSPTGVQLPIPGNADAEVRRAIADELKAAEAGTGGRSQVVIGPDKVDRSLAALRRGVYGKAYLVVRRNGWDPNFVATFTVVDPRGERMVSATTMLGPDGVPEFTLARGLDLAGAGHGVQQAEKPEAEGKKVELSEDAKNLADISPVHGGAQVMDVIFVARTSDDDGATFTSAGPNKLTAGKAAGFMRDPVAHEPLSYFVGESVRQVMPADRPVVALLSDELFEKIRTVVAGGTATTGQVAKTLVDAGYEFIDKDGWQVAKPLDIDRCQKHRVDRKEFKALLDATAAIGAAPLDSVARYALTSPETNEPLWDQTYASALYGSAAGDEVVDTRGRLREALRIYARLPEGQRRANGRTLAPGGLDTGDISSLVFRSHDGPKPFRRGGPRNVNMAVSVTSSFPNPDLPDASDLFGPAFERTDVFVGVPPTGLVLDGKEDTVLRVYDPKTGQSQIMGPDQVGDYRAMSEQSWGQYVGDSVGEGKKVQVLSRRRVNMQVNFSGRYQMTRSLSDYAPQAQSKLVSWNELPLELQDRIAASYKRAKEMYSKAQVHFDESGGRVRPPQP